LRISSDIRRGIRKRIRIKRRHVLLAFLSENALVIEESSIYLARTTDDTGRGETIQTSLFNGNNS
jgi:hypothetical protein